MILSQFSTINGIIGLLICLKAISIRFTSNNISCDVIFNALETYSECYNTRRLVSI